MLNTPEMFPLRLEAGVLSASPSYKSCHRGIRDSEPLNARPVNMLIQVDLNKLPSTETGAELRCEIVLRPPAFSPCVVRERPPASTFLVYILASTYTSGASCMERSSSASTQTRTSRPAATRLSESVR